MQSATMFLSAAEAEQRSFIVKVYGWMSLALLVTACVALVVAGSPQLVRAVFGNKLLFFGLVIAEIALVGYLAIAVARMSARTAMLAFVGYSALNGVTMAGIFLVFTAESIASTFFITAGTFAVMSAFGYITKRDLTSLGNLLFMGLVGIVIASLVNIFLASSALYWAVTYIGIFIFIGLVAYDTQKIKQMNMLGNEGTEADRKESIMGALTLYLDFINLFLLLLRLFGSRRR
jgi:hypothetical protein